MPMQGLLAKHGTKQLNMKELELAVEESMFGMGNAGFCIACGFEQDGCEPDAEGYDCEACDEPAVCGAEVLFMTIS
jgi:hypothetical protein